MGRITCLRVVAIAAGRAVAVAGLIVSTACSSGDELSAEQRVEATAIVDERAATTMIDLSDDDRNCAVDHVSPDDLLGLQLDPPVLEPAAEAVVECVGEDLIGASVLRSQAGSVDAASLECAVNELDRRFIVELVAGAMAAEPGRARAEIEVARALGVCLELEELLDQ